MPVALEPELTDALHLLRNRLDRDLLARLDDGDLPDNLLAHLRQRQAPKLPFSPDNLTRIAQAAREADPDEHAWEKRIADEAVQGRMYGASNPYCERFLEAPEGFDFTSYEHDDPQTIRGLNRQRWFSALARHYWDERDRRYFDALMRHWDFYWEKVPAIDESILSRLHAIGARHRMPAPYHELDNFIRLRNWWWAFWLSIHAPEMTGERCAVLLARCLHTFDLVAARGINTQEHNFTSMQMEALYLWALSLPECVGMDVWRHATRNNLESSLRRAIQEDGVQWEQSMGYHRGCASWYGRPYLIGRLNGDDWAEEYGDRLCRMAQFIDAVITPDGNSPLLSDSDRVADWRDALATLMLVDPEAAYEHDPGPSYLSVWWSDGHTWTPRRDRALLPTVTHFPDAGLAIARHPERAPGSTLILDNGPSSAGHAHTDNLTVHYDALGHPVIVDPGRWVYRKDAARAWVIRCISHNTIWLEDEPIETEAQYDNEFMHRIAATSDRRLSPITDREDDGIRRLDTRFKAYVADDTAEARRTVLQPVDDSAPWLAVIDRVCASDEHTWTNSWLLPAAEPVSRNGDGYQATLSSGLTLRFAATASEALTCRDESKFWCPNYGEQSPARWLRFSASCREGWRAFVFVPGETEPAMPAVRGDGQTVHFTIGQRTVTCQP